MELILRPERPEEFWAVENLTREAFWNQFQPGCTEHLVLHRLRESPGFLPQLSLVALADGQLVGHIAYAKGRIVSSEGTESEAVGFGPLSVLPAWQGRGVGSRLVEQSCRLAGEMGFAAVVIYGDPAFYRRFGFASAEKFGLSTSEGKNFDAFMALELRPGALAGKGGRFLEDEAYRVSQQEADEFDRGFSPKKKGEPRKPITHG